MSLIWTYLGRLSKHVPSSRMIVRSENFFGYSNLHLSTPFLFSCIHPHVGSSFPQGPCVIYLSTNSLRSVSFSSGNSACICFSTSTIYISNSMIALNSLITFRSPPFILFSECKKAMHMGQSSFLELDNIYPRNDTSKYALIFSISD